MNRLLVLILAGAFLLPGPGNRKFQEVSSPRSEWKRAASILVHTPGEELFDGVIHPAAGLFEDYFNVDSAAAEHRNYIRMLEKNGIKVHNVRDILKDMDIETLRNLASGALTYDLSRLAPGDTGKFGQNYRHQVLTRMSKNDLVRTILLRPEVIVRSYGNNTGVEADYVHHPLMNLYFTRDQSISTPAGQVMCRMNSPQRDAEVAVIKACYRKMGIEPVLEITGEGRLEGGDYIPAGTVSFIGCGMRTNMEAVSQMLKADVFGHDTVVVVKDHLRWQKEMHLDTYFNIIDKDLCTMQASRMRAKPDSAEYCTVDIYARAKGEVEYQLVTKDAGFLNTVKSMGYTVIPIGREDELHYANNYLTIGPRHIMAVGGQSEEFRKALSDNGVQVEWLPLENLIDGYGAAHCMTQVLSRYNK